MGKMAKRNAPFKVPIGYGDKGDGHFVLFNFDDKDMVDAINSVGNYLLLSFPEFFNKSPNLFDIYEKIYELQQDFKRKKERIER